MEKEILLSIRDIKKWFAIDDKLIGKPTSFVKAVDGVSFDVYKGEVRKDHYQPVNLRSDAADLRQYCF